MYDVSGVKGEDVEKYLKEDLLHLVRTVTSFRVQALTTLM